MEKFVAVLTLIFVCLPSFAFGWATLKTDHFTIFYESGYEVQAWRFLKTLEYYRPRVENLTGNSAFRLPVVIEDTGTISNGMTDPLNYRMFLYTYPPSGSGLGSLENWHADVAVHEYTHMLHLTKVAGFGEAFTTIFGNYFFPNLYSLGWTTEGITVYSESQLSKYQGRLNDGYYNAYIGARVKDNRFPSILEAAYPPLEYPYYDGVYNYGGVFFDYLAKTYGEDKFARFFQHYGSSFPLLFYDYSAKRVFGKSFPKLWKEWQKYEYDRYKDFRMEGERLTRQGWWISDLTYLDNKLYYARTYLKKTGAFKMRGFNKIVERDKRKEKTIVSTTSFFTTPIKVHNGKLYYAVAEVKLGYANVSYSTYGIYSVIHEKDLVTGNDRVILKDGIRDFEILEDGAVLYSKDRKDEFGSEISLYDRDSKVKKTLFNSDYLIDRIISDGDRIVVSARKDWENFSLYSLDLEKYSQMNASPLFTPLVHTPYFEGYHALHGNNLFFTANYGGIYSNYCYELSSGKIYRLTENGYATYPVYDEKDGMLYYIGLSSYGHDIYAKNAEWKEFQVPDDPPTMPPVFSLDKKVRKGSYLDNLKTMAPRLRLLLASADEDENRLGIFLLGEDALAHFPYSLELWYDFKSKEPLYNIGLTSRLFAPFTASVSSSNMEEEKELAFDMQYPLTVRLSPGLSGFYIGLSDRLFKDFDRHELAPYLIMGFSFPTTELVFTFRSPLERKTIGSEIDRTAIRGEMHLSQYVKRSEVDIKITGVYDPDSTYDPEKDDPEDSPLPIIRGYDDPSDAKAGASFSVDFSVPILPVRWGVWFPPYVFFEDICAGVFFDGIVEAKHSQINALPLFSAGLELHLETNLAAWLPMDIGVRFAVNKDRKVKIEPIIGAVGTF